MLHTCLLRPATFTRRLGGASVRLPVELSLESGHPRRSVRWRLALLPALARRKVARRWSPRPAHRLLTAQVFDRPAPGRPSRGSPPQAPPDLTAPCFPPGSLGPAMVGEASKNPWERRAPEVSRNDNRSPRSARAARRGAAMQRRAAEPRSRPVPERQASGVGQARCAWRGRRWPGRARTSAETGPAIGASLRGSPRRSGA